MRWWHPEESRRQEGLRFVQHMLTLPLSRDIVKALPDRPVIYLVYTERHGVLYVGATKSLTFRWRDHHHRYLMELADSQIAWFPVNAAELRKIESRVIELLSPPFNWIVVKGADKWSKCVRFHNISGRRIRPRNVIEWPNRNGTGRPKKRK